MRYIYVFRNLVNGKVYVGQTINPLRRKSGHLCAAKRGDDYPLPRSMRKHGIENFLFEVIEECDDAVINEREKFWIAHLDSRNPDKGYNLHIGGCSTTIESHRKLSEALKGNTHCVGRKFSEASLEKLRRNGWAAQTERRLGKKQTSTDTRMCECGKQFEVTISTNRKLHVKQFCSRTCANTRSHSTETKAQIAASLRKHDHVMLSQRIQAGAKLTDLMVELSVSYSVLKRIKRCLKNQDVQRTSVKQNVVNRV